MRENSKAYRGLKLPTYRQLKCGHTMNLISKHDECPHCRRVRWATDPNLWPNYLPELRDYRKSALRMAAE